MKRYIAVLIALIMIVLTFTACSDTVITDKNGVEHVAVVKNGELVQDKYGNLIEEVTNEDGKKVTQPFDFPEIYVKSKNEIENQFYVIDVPSDWKYDENLNVFRIQHDSKCSKSGDAICELSFNESTTGNKKILFNNTYATELHLQILQPEFVKDVKKYDTEIFGKEAMAYSAKYASGSTVYYYAFEHASIALGIKLIIADECADKISAEKFIAENVTLKSFE